MEPSEHGRVLVAKVGLDGHDRGVKVVARILRDAGFEVIYTGLFQTPDTVAAAAVDEDVDAIGLSMLSGAHMTLAPLVVDKVRALGADIPVVVGGIVPDADVAKLLEAGVAGVLTPGATGDQVVDVVRTAIAVTRLTASSAVTGPRRAPDEPAGAAAGDGAAADARRDRRRAGGPVRRQGEHAAGAFERDKAALREIGVPIETTVLTGGQAGRQRATGSTATATSSPTSTSSPTRCGPCRSPSPRCARRRVGRRCGSSASTRSTATPRATSR